MNKTDITADNYFFYGESPKDIVQIWDRQSEMPSKATISRFERGYEVNNGFRCIGSVPLEMLSPIPLRDFTTLTMDFGFTPVPFGAQFVIYDQTTETTIKIMVAKFVKDERGPVCVRIKEQWEDGFGERTLLETTRVKYLHELQNILRSLNIDGRNISFQRNSYSVQTYIQE